MQAAASLYQRGLELDPNNVTTIGDTGTLLHQLGRLEESIAFNSFTNSRDPVHPIGHTNLGIVLLGAGRYDEALESFKKTIKLSPDYNHIHYYLAMAFLGAGEHEAALAELQKESFQAVRLSGFAEVYHAMGSRQESNQNLEALTALKNEDSEFLTAEVLAYRGDIDAAFKWIDIAIKHENWRIADLHTSILFENLHGDPRWSKMLHELGNSPEQLAAIKFEVVLPK